MVNTVQRRKKVRATPKGEKEITNMTSSSSSSDESQTPGGAGGGLSPLKVDQPSHTKEDSSEKTHRRKQSYFLHTFETTPHWLKDNKFILGSYRVGFSWKQCVKSIFRIHNETMNVWTHLVGALLFMFLMVYTLNSLSPHGIDRLNASFPGVGHEIELVKQYQEQFKDFVGSIRSHVPSMDEVSDSLKVQAAKMHRYYEMGEHALSNMQAQFLAYVHRIDSVVDDMQKAVGKHCPSCTLTGVQNMHRSLVYNVKKVSELLEGATEEFVDLAKEKVGELASYVEKIDNKVLDFVLPDHLNAKDRLTYLPRTPIAWMIFSAICCLSFSAAFHLFYCHSESMAARFQRLDYAGICLLISGTASAAVYYLYYCDSYRRNLYAGVCFVLPLFAFLLTTHPSLLHPKYYPLRAGVFVAIGVSVAFPLIEFYRETLYWGVFHWLLVSGGVSYIVGAGLYASRVPERLWPGKFDIWFHSHSLFHIFVVAAAFQHYLSLRVLYEWRMANACPVSH